MSVLVLSHRWVMLSLLLVWAILLGLSALQDVLFLTGNLEGKLFLLDVDFEISFYTWYSSLLHFLCFALLLLVASQKFHAGQAFRWHWALLALVFLATSADEALSIHEKFAAILSGRWHLTGFFRFSQVIPLFILSVGGLLFYLPMIRSLPAKTSRMMLLAAFLFILGAVGLESIGGKIVSSGMPEDGWLFRIECTLEEALECVGLLLFIHTLLGYLRAMTPRIEVRFD